MMMMMMMMLIMPKWVPYVSPRKTEPHFGGNKWLKSTKTAGNIKRWSRGGKTNQFFIQCAPIKKKGKKHSPKSESLWTIKQNGTMHRHAIFFPSVSIFFFLLSFTCLRCSFSTHPHSQPFAYSFGLFKTPLDAEIFQTFFNSSWVVNSTVGQRFSKWEINFSDGRGLCSLFMGRGSLRTD